MPRVGDKIQSQNARWSFSDSVPENFDAHAEKSIPLYHEGHDFVVKLSDFFLGEDSVAYDLGCSTGHLTRQLAERNTGKDVTLIGVDCEPEMVKIAQRNCASSSSVRVEQADITQIEFVPTDFVVAYYAMQFVRPRFRQQVFNDLYSALNWGGGFVLFEKVRSADARFQDIMTSMYTDYKMDQGYTEQEIVHKTRSLKGVLEPFSTQGNLDMMQRAGFVDVMSVMKYGCFEGFLAIK